MMRVRRRLLLVIGAALIGITALPLSAGVARPDSAPVLVSGLNQVPDYRDPGILLPGQEHPYPKQCGSTDAYQEWERDHNLAADPVDPRFLVSAWTQDWQDATTVGFSSDGGRSWSRTLPLTSRCTWHINGILDENGKAPTRDGFPFEEATSTNDQWVAMGVPTTPGSPGVAYLTEIVMSPGFVRSAAIVNRSSDGGRTWSEPTVLEGAKVETVGGVLTDGRSIDQTAVIADRVHPGHADAIWTVFDIVGGVPTTTHIRIARTTDGGATWSAPATVTSSEPGRWSLAGQIAQLTDGSLLVAFLSTAVQPQAALGNTDFPVDVMVTRLKAWEGTWSGPQRLTTLEPATLFRLAAGPKGTAYVGWIRTGQNELGPELARTANFGSSWEIVPAGPREPGFPYRVTNALVAAPVVAVTDNGTIGLAFYDHRDDDPATRAPITASYWLRSSRDRGDTWSADMRVAGPFDQSAAPDANGRFSEDPAYTQGMLGDTQGIATMGSSFALTFVLSTPLEGANFSLTPTDGHGNPNPTDLFFARVSP